MTRFGKLLLTLSVGLSLGLLESLVWGQSAGTPVRVILEWKHDVSQPLRELARAARPAAPRTFAARLSDEEEQFRRPSSPRRLAKTFDPVAQRAAIAQVSVTPGLNFEGI